MAVSSVHLCAAKLKRYFAVWKISNSVLFQCENFKAAGAEVMQTPCDVVQAADITFSCVADPQSAKDVRLNMINDHNIDHHTSVLK